jgi:hypothetical protein
MKGADDRGSRLMYHARMFVLALLGGVALFLMLIGVVFVGLWLGIWHIEDR